MPGRYVFLAAIAVLVSFSCAKENGEGGSPEGGDIPAGTVKLGLFVEDHKSALDGEKFIFQSGDSICVNGKNLAVQLATDGSAYVYAEKSSSYNAIYPAEVCTSEGILVQPAQFYQKNSFGKKANYMYSPSNNGTTISFKHLFGVLKLTVKGTGTISSINVRDNAGGSLCGLYSIEGDTLKAGTKSQYDNVTLNCKTATNSGVTLTSSGIVFYLVLPARVYSSGLTITISEVDGHAMVLSSGTPRTIIAGHILSTPDISYGHPADQIYEYHLDNLVLGSDPVGNKYGFSISKKPTGFELCNGLTSSAEEAGTDNFSIDASKNGDFANISNTFARSRNIQSWKKVYYTREFHGYMACGFDGLKRASFKLPALTNAGGGFFKVEYSWKMAFRNGHLPPYGIRILHTTSTPGKILSFHIDGADKTSNYTDSKRWCSGADSSGQPYLSDETNSVETILVGPDDFKDFEWHEIKLVMGIANKETVLEFSPFGSTTDQPFYIDDISARRIDYPDGVGSFEMKTPSTNSFAWADNYLLQPTMMINPNSGNALTLFTDFHDMYNIKYIDLSVGSAILFKSLNVSSLDDSGWTTADARFKEVKGKYDDLGIKVWSIHLPYSSPKEGNVEDDDAFAFCSLDETVRISAVNRTKVIMKHLAVFEPVYMLIHPHRFISSYAFESGKAKGVKSFAALVSYANSITYKDGTHPILIIENVCNTGGSSSTLGATISQMNWFCSQVPGLGVCLDTSHSVVNNCNGTGNDLSSLVSALGSNLKHIHVHGNTSQNNKDLHLFPGYKNGTMKVSSYVMEDKIEWGSFYKALIDAGYRGTFCYEYSTPVYSADCRSHIANLHNVYENYYSFIVPQYLKAR